MNYLKPLALVACAALFGCDNNEKKLNACIKKHEDNIMYAHQDIDCMKVPGFRETMAQKSNEMFWQKPKKYIPRKDRQLPRLGEIQDENNET